MAYALQRSFSAERSNWLDRWGQRRRRNASETESCRGSSYESVSNVMADSVGRGTSFPAPRPRSSSIPRVSPQPSAPSVSLQLAQLHRRQSPSPRRSLAAGWEEPRRRVFCPRQASSPPVPRAMLEWAFAQPVEPVAGRPGAVSGVTAMSSAVTGSPGSGGPEKEPGCRPKNKPNDDAVKPYDVGTYSELKRRSRRHDQIDIHHVPQSHPASQVVPGYSRKDAPSIALPKEEHASIPTKKGSYDGTPSDLIAKDIHDLREYTQAPEDSIAALEELIEELLPDGC